MLSVMSAFAKAAGDTFLSDSERKVAEEEGFEPPVDLRPRLISSQEKVIAIQSLVKTSQIICQFRQAAALGMPDEA